jgi:hypothetical protein
MALFTTARYKKLASSIYNQGFGDLDPRIMNLAKFNLGVPDEVFALDAASRTWVLAFIEGGAWGYTVVEISDSMNITNKIEPIRFVAPASEDISATIMFLVSQHGQ